MNLEERRRLAWRIARANPISVVHFYYIRGEQGYPICGTWRQLTRSSGFAGTRDWSEVTCKKCLAKRPKSNIVGSSPKGQLKVRVKFALRQWGIPGEVTDHIDYDAHLDSALSTQENIEILKSVYPVLASYEAGTQKSLRSEERIGKVMEEEQFERERGEALTWRIESVRDRVWERIKSKFPKLPRDTFEGAWAKVEGAGALDRMVMAENPPDFYGILKKFNYDRWIAVYWAFVEYCKQHRYRLTGVEIERPDLLRRVHSNFMVMVNGKYDPYFMCATIIKQIVKIPMSHGKTDQIFADGNRRMAMNYARRILSICNIDFSMNEKEGEKFRDKVRWMDEYEIEKFLKLHCIPRSQSSSFPNNSHDHSSNQASNSSCVINQGKGAGNINSYSPKNPIMRLGIPSNAKVADRVFGTKSSAEKVAQVCYRNENYELVQDQGKWFIMWWPKA